LKKILLTKCALEYWLRVEFGISNVVKSGYK